MISFKPIASTVQRSSAGRRCSARPGRATAVKVQALFGWGNKKNDEEAQAREEQWQAQQELLAKRRTGEAITEANERRSKVKSTMASRKAERKNERDMLAQGIMPDSLKNWKPYMKKEDAEGTSGIVIPMLPFGLRKFDEGERFDLRSPYADDGWVDPEETDMMSGLKNWSKKMLNFTGVSPPSDEGKPIIWASDYAKNPSKYKKKKPEGQ